MGIIGKMINANGYLDRTPRIKGVNRFPNFEFLESIYGRRDAVSNQVCQSECGFTTPYVSNKANWLDSYVDQVYLSTSRKLEPIVREANSLVIELNLMLKKRTHEVAGSGEEAQRQAAASAASAERDEIRKREILERISDIRVQSDMINESLMHHIERAEGILYARISKYWRGVLSASTEELEHFPNVVHRDFLGRAAYSDNREKLVAMINNAIKAGGGVYEV